MGVNAMRESAQRAESYITLGKRLPKFEVNPINSEWILEGQPVARTELLSRSEDGYAYTVLWDCTAGRFNWFYGADETLHILEGDVTLKYPSGKRRRVVAGDIIFFPSGSSAEWTVHSYVRKLAFCRAPLPAYLAFVRQLARAFKRLLRLLRAAPSDVSGSNPLLRVRESSTH